MPHEHRWIDIGTVGSQYERRMCVSCGREERRPHLDNEEKGWEVDNEGHAAS